MKRASRYREELEDTMSEFPLLLINVLQCTFVRFIQGLWQLPQHGRDLLQGTAAQCLQLTEGPSEPEAVRPARAVTLEWSNSEHVTPARAMPHTIIAVLHSDAMSPSYLLSLAAKYCFTSPSRILCPSVSPSPCLKPPDDALSDRSKPMPNTPPCAGCSLIRLALLTAPASQAQFGIPSPFWKCYTVFRIASYVFLSLFVLVHFALLVGPFL